MYPNQSEQSQFHDFALIKIHTMRNYYFLVCLLLSLNIFSQENSYQFNNISVKEGLSQNSIIRIFQDSKNFMWFCTRNGLNRYDGISFKIYRNSIDNDQSISNSEVTSICENKNGTFWIGTLNGLNLFDPSNETFTHFYHSKKDKNSISDSKIRHLLIDKSGNLWIMTTEGIDKFLPGTKSFKHIRTNKSLMWMTLRANGDICFTSREDGLFVFNKKTQQLMNYPFAKDDFIYTIFEDSHQNLWIGTWSSSLKMLNPETKLFESISLRTASGTSLNHEQISGIVEISGQSLMLATRNGLLVYDTQSKTVTQRINSETNQLSDNTIISLFKDKSGNIWIGSWDSGIYFYSPYCKFFKLHSPKITKQKTVGCINSMCSSNEIIWLGTNKGLIAYNPSRESYQDINFNIPSKSREIKYLYKDNDKIWISMYSGGLYLFDLKSKHIEKSIDQLKGGYVKSMTKDEAGNFWIATNTDYPLLMLDGKNKTLITRFELKKSKQYFSPQGIEEVFSEKAQTIWVGTRTTGLYYYNYKTKEMYHYEAKNNNISLRNNHISVVFKDSRKNLWIGTFGGGLSKFNPKYHSFTTYNHQNGLLDDAICSIVEDKEGLLWITTLDGISQFSPLTGTFKNYNYKNGYPLQQTITHSCIVTDNNTLYVGGMDALVSFNPSHTLKNPFVPNVVISKFKVWTDNVSETETNSELAFPNQKAILKYNQAAFTIYFAALNFVFPNKNQYTYTLEGFDKNWNTVKNERSATYTNIPPGKYTFRVKACNNDGVWNNTGTSFEINILPPPWKTWWAYLLYFITLGAVTGGYIYYFLNKQKLENDITIKQLEQKNLEENHQLGVRLFTNFSHELRTPLTLIIGPLNEILAKFELPDKIRPKLELIFKNAQRLLWLVNQLMDFRKLESGFMQLQPSEININAYLEETVLTFRELATLKNISIDLIKNETDSNIWIDKILIEKVFFNLLSNALKHTPKEGKIEIAIYEPDISEIKRLNRTNYSAESAIIINITNNGNGIAADELEKIFEPFYQAQNNEGANIYGTGIGLNLCKTIIELHHGEIWAESASDKGSTFKILLQKGTSHFSKEELQSNQSKVVNRSEIVDLQEKENNQKKKTTTFEIQNTEHFTVLVVEDNEDLRQYVKSLLIDKYTVLEAEDCAIGCQIAIEQLPDLILSDIMTPNMSGIELCNLLKNNDVTNHIPIVLLTALAGLEQMKEGFSSLADDYIVKPFDPELLQLRVENLINIRKRIHDTFRKNSVYSEIKIDLPSADNIFITKVFDYIKANMNNSDMGIDSFSGELGMSRSQLYRKVKSITGKSPTSLIFEIRMNAAADLLKKSAFNINEITDQLGFNDSSYFGKCFKAHFGVTPGEYKG